MLCMEIALNSMAYCLTDRKPKVACNQIWSFPSLLKAPLPCLNVSICCHWKSVSWLSPCRSPDFPWLSGGKIIRDWELIGSFLKGEANIEDKGSHRNNCWIAVCVKKVDRHKTSCSMQLQPMKHKKTIISSIVLWLVILDLLNDVGKEPHSLILLLVAPAKIRHDFRLWI